jgi:hypothetical protein
MVSTFQPISDARDGFVEAPNVPRSEQSATGQCARVAQRLAAIGQMTGCFVHDLRNILAVIESALSQTEKSSEQPDRIRAYIAGAREAVSRGLKLTSEILTLAKQQELETHPVNANDLLNSLEVLLKYGVEPIIFQLVPDIAMCLLDPSQFNAAILNLVLNARDATSDSGDAPISPARCVVEIVIEGLPPPGLYVQCESKTAGMVCPRKQFEKSSIHFDYRRYARSCGRSVVMLASRASQGSARPSTCCSRRSSQMTSPKSITAPRR